VASGTYDLLFDHQIRVGPGTTDHYYRRVIQVMSTSGVQSLSQVSIDFDPSYERLVFHQVRVLRAGHEVWRLAASDVSVIRPERESGDSLYSGELSALVFPKDLRPGDVLDYAYSLFGSVAAEPPSFALTLEMGYGVPVARLRHRLLWPRARPLYQRDQGAVGAPVLQQSDTQSIYTWAREAVPAIAEEEQLPPGFDPYPRVDLSEFASWADVARWTAELYAAVEQNPASLDPQLESWASLPLQERALAAVRFVQDDVRYLGFEIGPGAYQPRPPAQVLAQRFGDCKDKALLLSTLLRRLGLDARPALVSTTAGRAMDEKLPSPFAFDHVIVRLRLGGKSYFIDPTVAQQGGTLLTIAPPVFERALVVDPDTRGLEPIPRPIPEAPTTFVEESYDVRPEAATALEVRTLYRGADADDARADLADTSVADVERAQLNQYARLWDGLEAQGKPRVEDRREENTIEIRSSYKVRGFWTNTPLALEAWSLADALQRPATVRRSMPLGLEHPASLVHRLIFRLPLEPDQTPEDATVENAAFRLERRTNSDALGFTSTLRYESRADVVSPQDLPRYLADLDRARASLRLTVARPTGRKARNRRIAVLSVAGLALGLSIAAMAILRRRRRQLRDGVSPA
jgi:transglutaminase-like putative cysteine protease